MNENEEEMCKFCHKTMHFFDTTAEYICKNCGYTIQTNVFIDQFDDYSRVNMRKNNQNHQKKSKKEIKIPIFIKSNHNVLIQNGINEIKMKSKDKKYRINDIILALIIVHNLDNEYIEFIKTYDKSSKSIKRLEDRIMNIVTLLNIN